MQSTSTMAHFVEKKQVHSVKKSFMCDRCGFSSNKKHNLTQHVAAQHEKIFHHCDECDFKSFYMHKLKKHMQIVHAGILLSCDLCPFKTQTVSALRTHKKTTHSVKYFFCDKCEFKTVYQHSLRTHQRTKHEGIRYDCKLCDYKGGTIYALNDHIKIKHENFRLQCDMCDFTSSTQGNLNVHKKANHSVNGSKLFCDQCTYSTTYPSALKRHVDSKHEAKPIFKECNLQVSHQPNADRYRKKKHDENTIKHEHHIEMVNMKENSQIYLKAPAAANCNSPYNSIKKCKVCGYTLAMRESYDEHVVSVHLTNEFSCDICGAKPLDFVEHYKRHLDDEKNPGELMTMSEIEETKTELHSKMVGPEAIKCAANTINSRTPHDAPTVSRFTGLTRREIPFSPNQYGIFVPSTALILPLQLHHINNGAPVYQYNGLHPDQGDTDNDRAKVEQSKIQNSELVSDTTMWKGVKLDPQIQILGPGDHKCSNVPPSEEEGVDPLEGLDPYIEYGDYEVNLNLSESTRVVGTESTDEVSVNQPATMISLNLKNNEKENVDFSPGYSCKICNIPLSMTQSVAEHAFNKHAYMEGLCHFCGIEDQEEEDFVENVNTHLRNPHTEFVKVEECPLEFSEELYGSFSIDPKSE